MPGTRLLGVALTLLLVASPVLGQDRVTDDLVVLYPMQTGAGQIVFDQSGVAPALNLTIADPGHVAWITGGGLQIQQGTIIGSGTPATKVTDAMTDATAPIEPVVDAISVYRLLGLPSPTGSGGSR